MKRINAQELQTLMKTQSDLLILNVLDQDHFDRAHIPGSRNIPVSADDFVARAVLTVNGDKTRPVAVHCANAECTSSSKAVTLLEQAGFTSVYHFEGGIAEWRRAGFRVETPELAGATSN